MLNVSAARQSINENVFAFQVKVLEILVKLKDFSKHRVSADWTNRKP